MTKYASKQTARPSERLAEPGGFRVTAVSDGRFSLRPSRQQRRAALLIGTIFLLALAAFQAMDRSLPLHAQSTARPTAPPPAEKFGIAAGSGALIRAAEDGAVLGQLDPGSRVIVIQRSTDGAWFQVRTPGGAIGWVDGDQLIVVNADDLDAVSVSINRATPTPSPTPTPLVTPTPSPPPSVAGAVTVDGGGRLNVRSGPGLMHPVIGKLDHGAQVDILGRTASGDWYRVSDTTGTEGWVSTDYVDSGDLPAVLTPAPAAADSKSVAPATNPSRAPATGLQGTLVIQSRHGGAIYTYDLQSGRLAYLTIGFDPAVSPDGEQVAFTRGGGENGVYVINMDGSGERLVFGERSHLRAPKWSPDGRWILFERGDETYECRELPDGRCVTEEWLHGNRPWLDIDGLPRATARNFKLSRVAAGGGEFRDIPTLNTARAADWNSAGIVYQSKAGIQRTADDPDARTELVTFDILKQYYLDPDWQPGGGQILFQRREASHWEIFRVNPDGGNLVALTRPETTLVDALPSNVAPAWSPDGRHIVYLSSRTADEERGPWRVWVMDADGGNKQPLSIDLEIAYGFAAEQMLDWGP